jgi:RHS repeat-associated protein
LLFVAVELVTAAPGDIDPPDVAEPKLDRPSAEVGAYAVNDRTGAASYTYSFNLPPTRGTAPKLGLAYSSNGAVHGGLAQGWTLTGLSAIRRDVTRENSPGTQQYTADFGDAVLELQQVTGDQPLILPPGVISATTWRAKLDRDFTRFYKAETNNGSYWIAETTDGRSFYFGDQALTRLGDDWRLSHVVDRNGNAITYTYEQLPWASDNFGGGTFDIVDLLLRKIEYSSNSQANLPSQVSIGLDWSLAPRCSTATQRGILLQQAGLDLPVGARVDETTGSRRILALDQLDRITVNVRDGADLPFRQAHQWILDYSAGAESCNRTVSPRRRIADIREFGAPSGSTVLSTPGPTVSFNYGSDPGWNRATRIVQLPITPTDRNSTGAGEQISGLSFSGGSSPLPPVYSMLADMDGDGLPDLVRATGTQGDCRAFWYKNLGGTFDLNVSGAISLPTVQFQQNIRPVGSGGAVHYEAECSLAGSWWAHVVPNASECHEGELHEHEILVYRWVDVDGDGRTDLITEHYQDHGVAPPPSYPHPDHSRHPFRCQGDFISFPDQSGQSYVWQYRRNVVGPDGPTLSGPSTWTVPTTLVGIPDRRDPQSPPLGPRFIPAAPESIIFDIIDVNGDHVPDLVTRSFTHQQLVELFDTNNRFVEWVYCSVDPRPEERLMQFNVYLGNGAGFSRTAVPMVLPNEVLAHTNTPNPSDPNRDSLSCRFGSDGEFVDINGDGLPDYLWSANSGGGGIPIRFQYFAHYGQGLALDPKPVRLYDVPNANATTPQQSGPAFPRDYDHDGMVDFPCLDGGCDQAFGARGIAFGTGGGFNAAAAQGDTPDPNLFQAPWYPTPEHLGNTARLAKQDTIGQGYRVKNVIRDYVDLDGDGVSEEYQLNENDGSLAVKVWNPTDGSAPGLLTSIDNGKGAIVQLRYVRGANGVMSNAVSPAYAHGWSDWIPPTFRVSNWIVQEVVVNPGGGQAVAHTTYSYQDPVFLADDGTATSAGRRFRGFQAVTTTVPRVSPDEIPPVIFERFSYIKDPDGVLDYNSLSEFVFDRTAFREGYQKQTRDQTFYATESYLGGVRFVHPLKRIHVECQPSFDPAPCDAPEPPFAVITGYDYRGLVNGETHFRVKSGNASALMWAPEVTTERTTATNGRPTILRRHLTDHILASGTLVLLERKIDQEDSRTVAHEDYFYDGAASIDTPGTAFGSTRGLLTKKRVYRNLSVDQITDASCGTNGTQCVDYGAWFDAVTGNKIRDVRPSEMARGTVNGDPSRATSFMLYEYDSDFALFAVRVTNPLGHREYRTFDVATGLELSELGPNQKIGRPPGCGGLCPAGPVLEERDWAYDGLGRLLIEKVPHDDLAAGYIPEVVRTLQYPDLATTVEQRAINWTGGPWRTTIRHYDGLSRIIDQAVVVGTFGPQTQVEDHRYLYDSRGKLARVIDPDPTIDGASVSHTFTHDARGRLTSVTAPDGAQTIMTFLPWEKSVRDADGNVKHQVFDGFSQLRTVDESGARSADVAHTSYEYDGTGRLLATHNGDGQETRFAYDGEGHRLSITKAPGRVWLYQYDADGNLVRKEDPVHRVTEYSYDAIGRETEELIRDARLPNGTSAGELGLGRLVLTYDTGPNGIGRLGNASMFDHMQATPGESPYASVDFAFDSIGNNAHETWHLSLPATGSRQFSVQRSFGPQSTLLSESFPNGSVITWTFDARGKIQAVAVQGQPVATYSYTVAGNIRTREGPPSQTLQQRNYTYDVRGRLLKDRLAIGSASLSRDYGYSPDSDVETQRIDDAAGDGSTLTTLMTFRYDALHRLLEARGGDGLGYLSGLTYSPAGNILTATVLGTQSTPDRSANLVARPGARPGSSLPSPIPSGVNYIYGDGASSDAQAVTELRIRDTSLAQFRYDAAGNMTDRITSRWPTLAAKYIYDNRDQIRRAIDSSGRSETYFYDHRERRFLAISSTGWRFYLGDDYELDVETGPNGREEQSIYVNGAGEKLARVTTCTGTCGSVTPERTLLYHDRRGDLLAAADLSGGIQAYYVYGAFGEILRSSGRADQSDWRRRFNGKEHDALDGLVYYGFRYYDPLIMRWLSADPAYRFAPDADLAMPQRLNLYSFSGNNALRHFDPDGLSVGDPHIDTFGSGDFDSPYSYDTLTTQRRRMGREAGLSGSALNDFARTGNVNFQGTTAVPTPPPATFSSFRFAAAALASASPSFNLTDIEEAATKNDGEIQGSESASSEESSTSSQRKPSLTLFDPGEGELQCCGKWFDLTLHGRLGPNTDFLKWFVTPQQPIELRLPLGKVLRFDVQPTEKEYQLKPPDPQVEKPEDWDPGRTPHIFPLH